MMIDQLSGLIDRTYAILPMYEESHRSDVIVRKLVSINSDLEAVAYYVGDINDKYKEKINDCITILQCLYAPDDIYEVKHSIMRKSILDVCGELKRVKEGIVSR